MEDIFSQIRTGKMVVMAASDGDEAEGDLVMAAEKVTPAHVNYMAQHGRGIVSVALPERRMRELGIPLVPSTQPGDTLEQAAALVEAREGVTTGISAGDRARTIQVLASDKSGPKDLVMPGHVLPLMALSGGVMMRTGRAEGAVDLVRGAGMRPVAALCAILRDDGEAARLGELREFAQIRSMPFMMLRDLISYRLTNELLVRRVGESSFSVPAGELNAIVFRNIVDGREHLALVHGNVAGGRQILVRLHSECLTGDVFGSSRCDCGEQLSESIRQVLAADAGVIIYLHQEGRGIGLGNKIKAYSLQAKGMDTYEANRELGFPDDLRRYDVAAEMLRMLGVLSVDLVTNNPLKIAGLVDEGIPVRRRIPARTSPNAHNADYLKTKRERSGHLIEIVQGDDESKAS
jgi:3,4-dihydroxy 2-butanone 4-phosphate synthase/GTP cyclohydrolase II